MKRLIGIIGCVFVAATLVLVAVGTSIGALITTSGTYGASGITTFPAVSFTDDFSTYQTGQPPAGWNQFGTTVITPVIEEVGGTGNAYKQLSFGAYGSGRTNKYLIYHNSSCSEFTATVKINFREVADSAGLVVAWQDANNHISVKPNVYWDSLEFDETANGIWRTRIATPSGSLPVSSFTDYWLRVSARVDQNGSKTAMVYWSTDGANYQKILTVTNLVNLDGRIGVATGGFNLPHTHFDDIAIMGCSPVPTSVVPIILVHGLCSNAAECWEAISFAQGLRAAGYAVSATLNLTPNNANLEPLANQLSAYVHEVKDSYRARGIQVEQVDLVGHSMGGVVARYYSRYGQRVRNLIMLGAPNHGSAWLKHNENLRSIINSLLGCDVDGAGDDLADTSQFLKDLNHLIGRVGGSDLYSLYDLLGNNVQTHWTIAGTEPLTGLQGVSSFFAGGPREDDGVVTVKSVRLNPLPGGAYGHFEVAANHLELTRPGEALTKTIDILAGRVSPTTTTAQARALAVEEEAPPVQQAVAFSDTLAPGQRRSHPVTLEAGVAQALFLMTYDQGLLGLTLTTPAGAVITPSSPAASYFYDATMRLSGYVVTAPTSGPWIAEVGTISVPVTGTAYQMSVFMHAGLVMTTTVNPWTVAPGQAAVVQVGIFSGTRPVTGAVVTGWAVEPEGTKRGLVFFDDGAHGDGVAGDGIYATPYTQTATVGSYEFDVTACGIAFGSPFVRQETAVMRVSDAGKVASQLTLQGRSDHSGVEVLLSQDGRAVVELVTNLTGTIALPWLEPGVYTATASRPGYLYAVLTGVVVTTGEMTVLPPVRLLGGDADHDGHIDIYDLTILGANFGLAVPPGDARADITGDNMVNIFDLVLVGTNYGLTAPRPWP